MEDKRGGGGWAWGMSAVVEFGEDERGGAGRGGECWEAGTGGGHGWAITMGKVEVIRVGGDE